MPRQQPQPLPPLPHLVSISLLAILAAYVGWANFWYAYDDAFITYRVAYNFASGQGLVYNPGEWFLGITTPGLALLLGLGGRLFGAETIPLLGGMISSVSLFAASVALYVFAARHDQPACGLFAGALLIMNPMIQITFGGEMPLQMALILWAFAAYAWNWRIASALLLAAATIVRPDGVLAAGVLGVYDLVRTRRVDWRAWLVFAAVLLPFAALGWIYYGSPLPATLGAKLAQRDSGGWMAFGRGLRQWFHIFLGVDGSQASFEMFSWHPRALGFWVIIGVPALWWYRFWLLPLAWVALFVYGYRTLQVPFYHWYAAPAVVGLVMVVASGISGVLALVMSLARLNDRRLAATLSAVAGLLFCVAIHHEQLRTLPITSQTAPMLELYADAGQWLQAHAAPDATVGHYEIGYLGYYAHRRVIDPLGLIDPAIPPHVATLDFTWAYRQYKPTYIFERSGENFGHMLTADWFTQAYQPLHTWVSPRVPTLTLTIYQRKAS